MKADPHLHKQTKKVHHNKKDGATGHFKVEQPGTIGKKVWCTFWIRTGNCDYTQQGCNFKHEMPNLEGLRLIGINEMPRWWKEKLAMADLRRADRFQANWRGGQAQAPPAPGPGAMVHYMPQRTRAPTAMGRFAPFDYNNNPMENQYMHRVARDPEATMVNTTHNGQGPAYGAQDGMAYVHPSAAAFQPGNPSSPVSPNIHPISPLALPSSTYTWRPSLPHNPTDTLQSPNVNANRIGSPQNRFSTGARPYSPNFGNIGSPLQLPTRPLTPIPGYQNHPAIDVYQGADDASSVSSYRTINGTNGYPSPAQPPTQPYNGNQTLQYNGNQTLQYNGNQSLQGATLLPGQSPFAALPTTQVAHPRRFQRPGQEKYVTNPAPITAKSFQKFRSNPPVKESQPGKPKTHASNKPATNTKPTANSNPLNSAPAKRPLIDL